MYLEKKFKYSSIGEQINTNLQIMFTYSSYFEIISYYIISSISL